MEASLSLLSVRDLSLPAISEIFSTARRRLRRPSSGMPPPDESLGRTAVSYALVFSEPSTRTRAGFAVAARELGMSEIPYSAATSSSIKGESLRDTALTLEAMGAGLLIVRHSSAGAPHLIARWTDCAVLNAGDGMNEHPTQALIDAFVLWERWGDLDGRSVILLGDMLHGRAAHSSADLLTRLGAAVTMVAPPSLRPADIECWPIRFSTDLDPVLPDADAVILQRIQYERMREGHIASKEAYRRDYSLTDDRVAKMPSEARILHPGPMNRGVEIESSVADSDKCDVLAQVRCARAVRYAVLAHLCSRESVAEAS